MELETTDTIQDYQGLVHTCMCQHPAASGIVVGKPVTGKAITMRGIHRRRSAPTCKYLRHKSVRWLLKCQCTAHGVVAERNDGVHVQGGA